MQIKHLNIPGPLLITPVKHKDERGFFSETFRADLLAANGVKLPFVQDNHVLSLHRGTLRGLHFQIFPHVQGKLVRCSDGRILDVAVDLRAGSQTYAQHVAVELSAENGEQLWVPPGFAHGYITLEDRSEVLYKVTDYYFPDCDRGISWSDPSLGIDWKVTVDQIKLSQKDSLLPRLAEASSTIQFGIGV